MNNGGGGHVRSRESIPAAAEGLRERSGPGNEPVAYPTTIMPVRGGPRDLRGRVGGSRQVDLPDDTKLALYCSNM